MKSKLMNPGVQGQAAYVLVLDPGEEAMKCLEQFAAEMKLGAARFTAIGAFSDAVLGYFDFSDKAYKKIPVHEQVEVLVLAGDITRYHDKPKVHAHVVLGRSDGSAKGGHLLEGRVRPTLEVMLTESPRHLYRRYDEASGLALIDPEKQG